MKVGRAAQTEIACRSHTQGRRKSLHVGIDRREYRILAVVIRDIFDHTQTLQLLDHRAVVPEAVISVKKSRIPMPGKIDPPGEEAERGRQRQAQPAQLNHDLRSEDGGRGSYL